MNNWKAWFPVLILTAITAACSWTTVLNPGDIVNIQETATMTAPLSATPTPPSTPIPTLIPMIKINNADTALFYGEWEKAIKEYQAILESNEDSGDQIENKPAALLGLGRTLFNIGHYEEALEYLKSLVDKYPDSIQLAGAHFTAAKTYQALELYDDAAESYQRYLDLRSGLIDSYVLEWRGDALAEAGDLLVAIDVYQSSITAPRLGSTLPVELKIANTYAALGDYDTALLVYQDIYTRTTDDYTKAHVDVQVGNILFELGMLDDAYESYIDAVKNYPLSYDSYQALVFLVESGYPVSEFDRGLVDYFAGQYSLAIAAFDRYLSSSSENAGTAYYYRGLAFRALDDPESALDSWEVLIQSFQASEFWDRAWEETAYTQWAYLNQYAEATETLLNFVEDNPTHSRAAEFLFDAAQIAERDMELAKAAGIWDRIPPEYPSSELVQRAIFLAGISYYRIGNYNAAQAAFNWLLNSASEPGIKAKGYFWLAKAYSAVGDDASEESFLNFAANADPTGYYSDRARDFLVGMDAFEPPVMLDLAFEMGAEREFAENWVRSVFVIPEAIDLSNPGPLLNDMRFVRGTELWNLGQYEMARSEFEAIREEITSSPMDNFRLANYLVDLGLYRTAIFSARQLLDLNDMDDAETLSAPVYFNHLRFGSYYKDLIFSAGEKYGFDPLFLFSVLRQESLFEGFVRSSAGAQGLMQIMPATAEDILSKGVWPADYSVDDLYRPVVNINLGVDYLDSLRQYFDGDLYLTLAAYNAGPGNAQIWHNLAGDDPDLFLEIIRFEETRNYIKGVYEVFSIYKLLYDRSP